MNLYLNKLSRHEVDARVLDTTFSDHTNGESMNPSILSIQVSSWSGCSKLFRASKKQQNPSN